MTAAALLVSIIVVRTSSPGYLAKVAIIESEQLGASSLSLLPGVGSLLQGSSAAGELEAILRSRRLALSLASDVTLKTDLIHAFPEPRASVGTDVRRTIRQDIFGLPAVASPDLASRLQQSLRDNILISDTGKIIEVSYTNIDPAFAGRLLGYALDRGQRFLVVRQREQALNYQRYLIELLTDESRQDVVRVISQILPAVIASVTRLSGPSAQAFAIIDPMYVDPVPVRPRVGLIVAVCLAIGIVLFLTVVVVDVNRTTNA